MNGRPNSPSRTAVLVAAALLGAAVVATTVSLWRALDLAQPPAPTAGELENPGRNLQLEPAGAVTAEDVAAAVDLDPFHPERRRPGTRFRLPEERTARAREPAGAPTRPSLELHGTVVLPDDRGFAMVASGGESPRVVRIGQSIGGYRLTEVERGRAVFISSSGRSMSLTVRKAGS
jgi:hypothetical protein